MTIVYMFSHTFLYYRIQSYFSLIQLSKYFTLTLFLESLLKMMKYLLSFFLTKILFCPKYVVSDSFKS